MSKTKTGITFASLILLISVVLNMGGCVLPVQAEDLMHGIIPNEVEGTENLDSANPDASDFAVRLFKESAKTGENTLISPLSLMCALAMTANGADGKTLEQMEAALGMSKSQLNSYLYTYVNSLPQGDKYKLNIANSIWFTEDQRFEVNPDFLQVNADYYGADVYKAPFDSQTLRDINNWVKKETDGMIPKVLRDIPPEAVMYLVNALAFEAEWSEIYEDHQVRDGKFTKEDGTVQNVEMMYASEGKYLNDGLAQGFIKYYSGRKYAFAALLPNEGVSISDYISSLDGRALNSLLESAENRRVKTAIPKFETEYEAQMSDTLIALGMTDAFDIDVADFKNLGTSKEGNIFINRVIHKTYIKVGERGTKAGAVTVVEMNDTASADSPDEIKVVYLDRPFLYMLIDCENNVPFFIGALTDAKK